MKKRLCLFFLFLALLINQADAQKFGIAATGGINFSQINGDSQLGYDKIGYTTGLRSITNLKGGFQLHVEFLYSQRGAAPSDLRKVSIDIDYMEIPVYISYDFLNEHTPGSLRILMGASYGRLIAYETEEVFGGLIGDSPGAEILPLDLVAEYFNPNDLGFFGGIQWLPFNDYLGIELRQTFSVNLLFDQSSFDQPIQNKSLRSYFFSVRLFYELNRYGEKKIKGWKRR